MRKAKIIFVGNYKGGVGKTTSIYQIALHMVQQKKKVLVIDLDPQCSLSEICLARNGERLEQLDSRESLNYIYDMWMQYKHFSSLSFSIKKDFLIRKTPEHVHFIPSNTFYAHGGLDELALKLKDDAEDLFPLQQFLTKSKLQEEYDYILFDCPPSNNIITQGAFLLSDYYLIPSIFQTLSIRGVVHYIKTVENIYEKICINHEHAFIYQSHFGEKPQLIGIFETLKKGAVNNRDIRNDLISDLRSTGIKSLLTKDAGEHYIFDSIIHHYEEIARGTAQGFRSDEYGRLTDEILVCLEQSNFYKAR